ncbi:hypothetical protein WJX77_011085 [Trebouxia sp. C0004]
MTITYEVATQGTVHVAKVSLQVFQVASDCSGIMHLSFLGATRLLYPQLRSPTEHDKDKHALPSIVRRLCGGILVFPSRSPGRQYAVMLSWQLVYLRASSCRPKVPLPDSR